MQIEVKGLDRLVRDLRELGSKRIPNYLARAINALAADAQKAMIQETQEKLTVRGSWFKTGTRFGYNRQAATKDKLEARVFTRAPWMEQQEGQTFKTASKSFLTLPAPAVRPGGRTDPKKIPSRLWPSRMGPKLFRIETKGGPVLAQRLKRAGLRIMYYLERVVHYKRRVFVVDAGVKAIEANATQQIEKNIEAAIREQGLR